MSNKIKSEQLDHKINQLKELDSKFKELASQCKNFLIDIERREEYLEKKEIQLKNAIDSKQSNLKSIENSLLAKVKEAKEILEKKEIFLNSENDRKSQEIKYTENAIKKMYEEKSIGLPWLAEAIAEFYRFKDFEIAEYLENKKHPSKKGAELLRNIATKNKILRKEIRIARSFVKHYETLVPWLKDYRDEDLDELLKEVENENKNEQLNQDPVLRFIPKSEYKILSEEERNQKALDRYLNFGRKSSWRLGRDYERYIGFLYEKKGYRVSYEGINKGYEDLGIDLVCIKDKEIDIVQCKYWSKLKKKIIHEKHINQLYGTAVKYFIDHNELINPKAQLLLFPDFIKSGEIKATFVTSTILSDTAKKFADVLGIRVEQEKPLEKYPIIKCNISNDGEKIYHLPFDQQYDKTIISKPGEFYAETVKESMDKGFRRAWRWTGA